MKYAGLVIAQNMGLFEEFVRPHTKEDSMETTTACVLKTDC